MADVGLWASVDDGASWNLCFNQLVTHVAAHPTEAVHAVAVGGDAWASTDSFASPPVSLGLQAFSPASGFTSVAVVSPTHLLVGSSTGELFETMNYNPGGTGVLWSRISTPAASVLLRDIHVVNGSWYVACFAGDLLVKPASTPGVMRSMDSGMTWELLSDGMGSSRLVYSLHRAQGSGAVFHAAMWGGGLLRLMD